MLFTLFSTIRMENYNHNESLQEKVGRLEREKTELLARIQRLEKENQQLKQENLANSEARIQQNDNLIKLQNEILNQYRNRIV